MAYTSKNAKATSDSYAGKFDIPYSRASMKNDSSESIGAGDVGSPVETCNDGAPSPHSSSTDPMGGGSASKK